ncbi:hypothetical protein Mmc1_1091 [Magnetococcus marinus MC-1]|uniref:Uncharacterized protein n=1 Tax=Magnetococcus marinus (strain ATCC BAA-1437 / JCM 17883 / MC-1) TaxID=156889 RepID=A0L6L6_MAGMM|nr:hypothetical protein [Magnetococcus marinus]ABK43609.1 hypothetical protein Mmc1_1091 [Magnetococcus marinus MC-1]
MSEELLKNLQGMTPASIVKLEKLKGELESLHQLMLNTEGMSQDEIEGRIRQFRDKEQQVKAFLAALGLLPS